ncbi:MAG: formylglycine-generating enzyme family protein [Thermoguttaceae bacterium]|nr:formylglycine-generating enzyme family protein [Thermoguttaceae bacterium]
MIDPISLGMAIYGLFKGPMLVGNFLTTRHYRKTTSTTLNGIVTDVEVVRRNIAEMASDISTDFAELTARTDILIEATNALQEATRRFDAKLDLLMEASFKAGWEQLELAAGASSESRCERYLERAEEAFVASYSLLKNERLITARYGAALAQVQMGELTNGLATLEKVASIPFDSSAPNSDYWTFLRMKVEVRDYLASLGSQPTLADYWNERTARFQKLAFSAPSQESRMQAFLLAQATQLLSSDLKAGAEALKSASRGVDKELNAEGAQIYETTFGEKFDAVEAEPQAGTRKVLTIKGVDFAFRYCPAGTFWMGSPSYEAERYDDETRHEVTLTKGFWMLETSVTQGMFRAIAGSNPSYFQSGDNYPVESVSWFDCQEFCESLNALGVAPAGFEFRLPWEAEWEYACRAGTTGAYNVDRPLDELGWYNGNSGGKTRAVGGKRASAWGLYDMHGNVWEWCADWYGAYATGPQTDPTGPSSGSNRVLRGGSWSRSAKDCRSANRRDLVPTDRLNFFGFRLVLGR